MRTDSVLKTCALAILLPAMLAACGDDTAVGGGGSDTGGGGNPTTGGGGFGGEPTIGGGGFGGGGAPPVLNDDCGSAQAIEVAQGDSITVPGSMRGAADDYTTFCADNQPGRTGNDLMYEITATDDCTLEVSLEAEFDGVISYRPDCDTDDGFCFNSSTSNDETATFHAAGGTFFIMVTDFENAGGEFTLSIECTEPACGDSVINEGEDCDVGDIVTGDGCDATCHFEPSDPAIDTCVGADGVDHPIALNDSITIPGTGTYSTIGADESGTGSCMFDPVVLNDGSEASADHIHKITPTANGMLTLRLGNDEAGVAACKDTNGNPVDDVTGPEPVAPFDLGCYDRAIHVRTTCATPGTEVACRDFSQDGGSGTWWTRETLTFAVTANTDYFVFVDGWLDYGDGSDVGEYILEVSLAP